MGLTIYYNLDLAPDASEERVRELVGTLRERAVALGVDRVTEVHRVVAQDSEPRGDILRDLDAYVRFNAAAIIEHPTRADAWLSVPPLVAYAFGVVVGRRCEALTLGLGRYPRTVVDNGVEVDTGLGNWRWHSYTKTQFASVYGADNFLACHRTVIALLDAAAALGIEVAVRDDSGYSEHRDETRLLASVDEWNRLVARLAGSLGDAFNSAGLRAGSPIFRHPDFERLEMG